MSDPTPTRLPPFSLLEFSDLVSAALEPPVTALAFALGLERKKSAQNLHLPRGTGRVRHLLAKLKTLVSRPRQPRAAPPSLALPLTPFDLDDAPFAPYLPLAAQYERRLHAPSHSSPSHCAPPTSATQRTPPRPPPPPPPPPYTLTRTAHGARPVREGRRARRALVRGAAVPVSLFALLLPLALLCVELRARVAVGPPVRRVLAARVRLAVHARAPAASAAALRLAAVAFARTELACPEPFFTAAVARSFGTRPVASRPHAPPRALARPPPFPRPAARALPLPARARPGVSVARRVQCECRVVQPGRRLARVRLGVLQRVRLTGGFVLGAHALLSSLRMYRARSLSSSLTTPRHTRSQLPYPPPPPRSFSLLIIAHVPSTHLVLQVLVPPPSLPWMIRWRNNLRKRSTSSGQKRRKCDDTAAAGAGAAVFVHGQQALILPADDTTAAGAAPAVVVDGRQDGLLGLGWDGGGESVHLCGENADECEVVCV
ncbi:hypothetical protein B0H10DRAFT_1968652 [Mycena sp. CBHHK59/15]|nr:hypothetical protein B0H10DRAFT_1968652 [Mycena sp. CBHHK59/15]